MATVPLPRCAVNATLVEKKPAFSLIVGGHGQSLLDRERHFLGVVGVQRLQSS